MHRKENAQGKSAGDRNRDRESLMQGTSFDIRHPARQSAVQDPARITARTASFHRYRDGQVDSSAYVTIDLTDRSML